MVLLWTVSSTFLTALCQNRDSLVQVRYRQLQDWAAKRVVSDTMRRELARDFAEQDVIIHDMRKSETKADTVIARQARMIGDKNTMIAQKDDKILGLEKKNKRQRSGVMRWVERVGLLVGGFFIASQL